MTFIIYANFISLQFFPHNVYSAIYKSNFLMKTSIYNYETNDMKWEWNELNIKT